MKSINGCEVLSPEEREFRSSMITFRIGGKNLNDITSSMSKENIRVRPVGEVDMNGIRISFHLYNNESDLNKALETIKKIIKDCKREY
jgi:selenocysteine lyase/cysteine desulfurase